MTGTRFLLFPQYDEGMHAETVTVSSPAGSLAAGPSDHAMHVIDPVRKLAPYEPPHAMPPYRGPVHAPARPGPGGHFDHIAPHTPQFLAAHMFGLVRRTLDIWERHLRRPIVWWHADTYPRMELIPVVAWRNAQSGPGFLEMGVWPAGAGQWQSFALNHDVVAHEIGHTILFGTIGVPRPDRFTREFLAFHESFADLIGLVAALHFSSVRTLLLRQTEGNLYVLNLVSRLAETATHAQIRVASNTRTLADVADLTLSPDLEWQDPTGQGRNAHALAEPLTGAVFDVLVELYQAGLVARRLIAPDDDARGWTRDEVAQALARWHGATARGLARFAPGFDAALAAARDAVGAAMAHAMTTLLPEEVSFARVAARMVEALAHQGRGAQLGRLVGHFLARGIDPRPHLRTVAALPPLRGLAMPVPSRTRLCPCGSPAHVVDALRLMPHRHRESWTPAHPDS